MEEVFTVIIGGKAGDGTKKAGQVIARIFSAMDRHVFLMDDYPSLIRGGHNFSVISTSTEEITSHYANADIIVSIDQRSYDAHADQLKEGGLHLFDEKVEGEGVSIPIQSEISKYGDLRPGTAAVAAVAALINMPPDEIEKVIASEYGRSTESNISFARTIYEAVWSSVKKRFHLRRGNFRGKVLSGNEAIALGAAAGGLDIYFAYPMTPASSILHFLAAHSKELGVTVVHPENEIAVANMAIGAAFTSARAMVGTSGGGFALMEEALSLAGMAEVPLLCVLSSRPGPSTGVPTYTEQADLRFAINQGHGEFPRIVASPGSIEEAFYLTAEMLSLVWRFQTVGILLTEKHLSESRMAVSLDPSRSAWPEPLLGGEKGYKRYAITDDGISPMLFPPSAEMIKWNSYEHDEAGITTEEPEMIAKMHDKRNRKGETMREYLKTMRTVNTYGSGEDIVITYGSTTMSVLEAVRHGGLDVTVVQPVYLEPFPVWEFERFSSSEPVIVEQSSTGQFATLLKEKTGIEGTVIRRYDGRPFEPENLADDIRRCL